MYENVYSKRALGSALAVALLCAAGAPAQVVRLTPRQVEEAVTAAFPGVVAALAAVEAAEHELTASRTLPDISLQVGVARNAARVTDAASTDPFAEVEWELPLPWRYRAGARLASERASLAHAELALVEVELVTRVRALITELAAAQERAELLAEQHEVTAGLLDLISLRVEAGESRELDRLRAVVELGQIARELELARADGRAVASTLARLSGGALPAEFEIELSLAAATFAVEPAAAAEAAAASYPAVRTAQRRARVAEAAAELVAANRLPSLVTRLGRDIELDSETTALSVGLRLPIWNANRGEIAAARARSRHAAATLDSVAREVAARAEALAHRYDAAHDAAAHSATVLLPTARQSRDLAEFSYRQGEASLLEALDARRAFQEASLQDLELRRSLNLLGVALEALTGSAPAATPSPENANGSETDD